MTVRAIAIIEPQLSLITQGRLSLLWRVGATMAGLRVGDRLWVREPFHLLKKFSGLAPSVAAQRGAQPIFITDLKADGPVPADWLTKKWDARTLPRKWHRQHLVITGFERRALQTVTEPEAKALGFNCVAHFARGWDANLMFGGHDCRWAENPTVTALGFDRVEGPVQ